jgi:hypothetical protein
MVNLSILFAAASPVSKLHTVTKSIHTIMSSSNPSASLTPSEQPPHPQSAKVGRGIVHEGYIYGITDDSPLAAALDKITDKKEQCKFISEHGKKGGKVDFDTKPQKMEEVVRPESGTSQ